VHIGRLRIPGHAKGPDAPFALQTKTQHHCQWQRQAVRTQLHRLPSPRLIPQLPAIGVTAQAAKSPWVRQENVSGQRPGAVQQTAQGTGQTGPEGDGKQAQRTQREQLGHKIRRQQLP